MSKETLFEFSEVRAQFEPKQIETIEHIIWMAKETGEPQGITSALLRMANKEMIAWPSGKLSFSNSPLENAMEL